MARMIAALYQALRSAGAADDEARAAATAVAESDREIADITRTSRRTLSLWRRQGVHGHGNAQT
jgi:hypothetical protein